MKPGIALVLLGLLAGGLFASDARAQQVQTILVESPAMRGGESMDRLFTPDGRNISPPLSWTNLPAGTRQIAVICEDHGAGNPPPWVHWIIYNIPGTATGLPAELPIYTDAPMPAAIAGAVHGNNGWGRPMYRGPAPPAGPAHNYNFVVYALNAELDLPAGLTRAEFLTRIEGHVIGKGELVPFYGRQAAPAGAPR